MTSLFRMLRTNDSEGGCEFEQSAVGLAIVCTVCTQIHWLFRVKFRELESI